MPVATGLHFQLMTFARSWHSFAGSGASRASAPTAIIVDSDDGYGMLRMLEILVEDVCAVRPFRSREEAEKWLAGFPV